MLNSNLEQFFIILTPNHYITHANSAKLKSRYMNLKFWKKAESET